MLAAISTENKLLLVVSIMVILCIMWRALYDKDGPLF